MAAALTPRVRLLTLCDGFRESLTEPGVYHLRGVRQSIVAPVFPHSISRFWLYMVLSSPCPGIYPGYIRVIEQQNDKAIFFAHLNPHPRFEASRDDVAAATRIRCSFPRPGVYVAEVWFYQEQGSDILKAESPFSVANAGE